MIDLTDPWVLLFGVLACVVAPLLLILGGGLLAGGVWLGRRTGSKAPESPHSAPPVEPQAAPARSAAPVPPPAPPVLPSEVTQPGLSSLPTARRTDRSPASAPTMRRETSAAKPAPVAVNPCPQCGYSNRPGARFCANCRYGLSAPPPAPAPPAATPLAAAAEVFPAKETPALETPAPVTPAPETPAPAPGGRDTFCWNCGQALRSASRFCPRCGSPV